MVRVRRFLFHEEIKHLIPTLGAAESSEVFITSTQEQLSAKDIDGLASILTPSHFKECDEFLPISLSIKIFMCHREFKKNSVSTFSLDKLCGYSAQSILSTLKYFSPEPSNDIQNPTEEVDGCGPQNKTTRVDQTAVPKDLAKGNQAAKCGPTNQCLKIKGPVANELVLIESQNQIFPSVNENIELLSQDSGMRGCWLRCKILRSSTNYLKVQYYDMTDVVKNGKLEVYKYSMTFLSFIQYE